MKKYAFFITILFLLDMKAQTNYTAIPDVHFEAALSAYDDIPNDHQVPTAAIDTITVLNVESQNIADLTGIEDFAALTDLRCSFNQITTLDLTQNLNLELLMASDNQLTDIDISQNTNLYYLSIWTNQLNQLDVSNNPNLVYIFAANNHLTQLDVSHNTHLYRLDCRNNQLTQLDVSVNTNLWWIDCARNQISQLDVSNLTNLHRLEAYDNQLTNLNLDQNGQMDWLRVQNNQLTELHIQNGNNSYLDPAHFDIRNNPDLHCVFVDDVTWCEQNLTNIDPQTHFVTNQAECDAGLEDIVNNAIKLYPNPVFDKLHILTGQATEYRIYNIQGTILQQGKITKEPKTITINHLREGMYLIQLMNNKKAINQVFIKK